MDGGRTIPCIDDRLIDYLRSELQNQCITYSTPPTPVEGGYDTAIYRFQLEGASDELSGPLILRVFAGSSSGRAAFESLVQGAVSDVGYPAPRVYFTCTDDAILGAGFLIMELMPGRLMADLPEEVMPEMLAEAHLHLHGIDADPIREALESSGLRSSRRSFDNMIRGFKKQAEERRLDWLGDGLGWLEENRPGEPGRPVVCHGDFHPLNLLVEDGRVSGVLDWAGFRLWEPAYDVGATVFLGQVAAPALLPGVDWSGLIRRYLEHYLKKSPLEPERVDYYSAFRCLWSMFEGAEGHMAWSHPIVRGKLTDYFQGKTGVAIEQDY
jgi:aminoglycoside phosphotransferase (APT) family kinase protein